MRLLLLATLVLAAPAAAASAQDVVARQMNRAAARMAERGYRESHTRNRGHLAQGQSSTLSVALQQGRRYAIAGVCDQDCSDLDLVLTDEDGNKIDEDVTPDDVPVVGVAPRWSGRFRIRVSMATCSANPCAFGLVVFSD